MEVPLHRFEAYRVLPGLGLSLCDIVVLAVLCVGNPI